jgi:hypothetical protein
MELHLVWQLSLSVISQFAFSSQYTRSLMAISESDALDKHACIRKRFLSHLGQNHRFVLDRRN